MLEGRWTASPESDVLSRSVDVPRLPTHEPGTAAIDLDAATSVAVRIPAIVSLQYNESSVFRESGVCLLRNIIVGACKRCEERISGNQ